VGRRTPRCFVVVLAGVVVVIAPVFVPTPAATAGLPLVGLSCGFLTAPSAALAGAGFGSFAVPVGGAFPVSRTLTSSNGSCTRPCVFRPGEIGGDAGGASASTLLALSVLAGDRGVSALALRPASLPNFNNAAPGNPPSTRPIIRFAVSSQLARIAIDCRMHAYAAQNRRPHPWASSRHGCATLDWLHSPTEASRRPHDRSLRHHARGCLRSLLARSRPRGLPAGP